MAEAGGTTQTIVVVEQTARARATAAKSLSFQVKGEAEVQTADLSLWTTMVEGLLQYTRVVHDLFPGDSLVASMATGCAPRVLSTWKPAQQSVCHVVESLGKLAEQPQGGPAGPTLTTGLNAALKLLAQRPDRASVSCLRVIYLRLSNDGGPEEEAAAVEKARDMLEEWRHRSPSNAKYLELMDVVVQPSGDTTLESAARSAQLGYFQYAVAGSALFAFLSKAVQQHFSLRSARVTGIPMKDTSSDHSRNYDVVPMLAPRAGEVEAVVAKVDEKGRAVQEGGLSLQWRTVAASKEKGEPAMQPCACAHRVTPLDVASLPSSCLLKHVLSGKTVTLGVVGQPTVSSHLLISHGGSVFLHCVSQALTHLESTPSITACNGGSVGDYRIGALTKAIYANRLRGDVEVQQPGLASEVGFLPIPLAGESKPSRLTKHFPMVFRQTVLFAESELGVQAREQLQRSLDAAQLRVLSKEMLQGCKAELKQFFIKKRSNSEGFAGQLRNSKRLGVYRQVLSELKTLLTHASPLSAEHDKLLQDFDRLEADRPEEESSGDRTWAQMDAVEKMTTRELQDANKKDANNTHSRGRFPKGGIPAHLTNMCFDYSNGTCARGDKCRFSHEGPGRKCYHCNQTGHLYRNCPMRGAPQEAEAAARAGAATPPTRKRRFSEELGQQARQPVGNSALTSLHALWNSRVAKRARPFAGSAGGG